LRMYRVQQKETPHEDEQKNFSFLNESIIRHLASFRLKILIYIIAVRALIEA
jgi:hypothetical protein